MHFALAHQIIERAQRLFDRCEQIPAMYLIQIDIICIEPAQTVLDRRKDMLAREADVVWITPCR